MRMYSRPTMVGNLLPRLGERVRKRCLRIRSHQLGIEHKLIRPYTPRHNGRSRAQSPRRSQQILLFVTMGFIPATT